MTPARWFEIQCLADAAAQRPASERVAWLIEACRGDAELQKEALALLEGMEWDDAPVRKAIESAASELIGADAERMIGVEIGAWRLIERIGLGGMGAVYRAERVLGNFEQQAALKLVNPALVSAGVLARFESERQILAKLSHPNIARLLDGGTTEDALPYLVMEYVEGEPIGAWCRNRKLDFSARLRLFQKVCAAVAFAHKNLIVHRDIKPSNILVDGLGEPRLLDFGVAKLIDADQAAARADVTAFEVRALTPRYASPEQIKGETITTATDVYSLGVLLYELLTGRLPYRVSSDSAAELQRAICDVEPERPSVSVTRSTESGESEHVAVLRSELSGDLDSIILMALRKEPEARYSSVALLAEDIERYLKHLPVHARQSDWRYRAGKFLRRHRAMTAATAAGLAALVGATLLHTHRLTTERNRALQAERTARTVTDFLVDTFRASDPRTNTPNPDVTARELLDRAAVQLKTEQDVSDAALREVGLTMGRAYAGLRLSAPARELARRAMAEIEAAGLQDSQQYAEALRVLASAAEIADDWQAARTNLEQALQILERHTGPESVDVARTLTALSDAYLMVDQHVPALEAAERAFSILKKTSGPDAVQTLDALHALSNASMFAGHLERSVEQARQAQEGFTRIVGPAHIKVVGALHIGALASYRLGRFREGLALAEQELEATRAAFPDDDGRLVQPLRMIYINSTHLGNVSRAFGAIHRAITLMEASPAPNLENLGLAYSNLGKILLDEGEIDAAEQWVRRAADVHTRAFGPDSGQLGYSYLYLGLIGRMRGDYPSARDYMDRAIAVQARAWAHDHVEVLKMQMHREYVELFAGNLARAAAGLSDVVARLDRSVGADHPISAQALGYLAEVNGTLGNQALADEQFRRALDRLEARAGRTNINFLHILQACARFAERTMDESGAKPILQRLERARTERVPLSAADLDLVRRPQPRPAAFSVPN